MYAIFRSRCSRKHAVPLLTRIQRERISPAVAHTHELQRKKTAGWLACEVADLFFGSGNGSRSRTHLVVVSCLDFPVNLLIPLLCQSSRSFCTGAPNLLTSEPPTTEHGGPPTDVDPESKKRNVWNWKACRFPESFPLSLSVRLFEERI
jgi:hypothetical protein